MIMLLMADASGNVVEHPTLEMSGRSGFDYVKPGEKDLIPLPRGSTLFTLPGARPVGWEGEKVRWVSDFDGEIMNAVSAFLPSGYTRTLLPGTMYDKPVESFLPLWSYTAVGINGKGEMMAAAVRSDALSDRFDPCDYDDEPLPRLVRDRLEASPGNRLLEHLSRCALEYHCFAAKNLFFGRWEAPLPASPTCNARCVGCISLQAAECCPASHERIRFVPSAAEIADVAVPHLRRAEDAIVSFGQGCEGEPLTEAKTLEEAVRLIRSETGDGTVHLNTNGYSPQAVRALAAVGLDSIRVSMNSTVPSTFMEYHRPRGFHMADVIESVKTAAGLGLFVSVNLFVFPGITDREEELDGVRRLITETGLSMIQMRNMNIDPELYLSRVPVPAGKAIGIRNLIRTLRAEFPAVEIGYYNRPKRLFGERLSATLEF